MMVMPLAVTNDILPGIFSPSQPLAPGTLIRQRDAAMVGWCIVR